MTAHAKRTGDNLEGLAPVVAFYVNQSCQIGVVGSRTYKSPNHPKRLLELVLALSGPIFSIVSGGARGVDSWASEAAVDLGLRLTEHNADWDRYGRSAGFRRNQMIVDSSDLLIAFWDFNSKGTRDTVVKALRAGKPVFLVSKDGCWWELDHEFAGKLT